MSAKPTVPPELAPYYASARNRAHLRSVLLLILPLLVAAVLIAVSIGGIWWFTHHRETAKKTTSNSSQQATKPKPSTNAGPQVAAPVSPEPGSSTEQAAPAPASASPEALANTGPDASIMALAMLTSTVAAAGLHVYQRRKVRNQITI